MYLAPSGPGRPSRAAVLLPHDLEPPPDVHDCSAEPSLVTSPVLEEDECVGTELRLSISRAPHC